jgi:hypothetical protein
LQNEQLWFKNTKLWVSKTRSFGSKNTKFRFEKPEVSFRKPEVSVQKPEVSIGKPEVSVGKPEVSVGKPEISVEKPEVPDKSFELETSVKVFFRNASVSETRNFELLCTRRLLKLSVGNQSGPLINSLKVCASVCFPMKFENSRSSF